MEEGPPHPDDPEEHGTISQKQRMRGDSDSSASCGSIISTRTLHSVDLTTVSENSRVYPNTTYFSPCDQIEQDRLAILHQVWLSALSGKLTTAPITAAALRILDVGTGPGDWAVAIARRFPYAEVVGVDLAVWDVEAVENQDRESGGDARDDGQVRWEIDDLDIWGMDEDLDDLGRALGDIDLRKIGEQQVNVSRSSSRADSGIPTIHSASSSTAESSQASSIAKGKQPMQQDPPYPEQKGMVEIDEDFPDLGWNFSEPFDFIHLRNLKGSFSSWPDVYSEIYKNLSPGGWVEVSDYDMRMPDDPTTNSWMKSDSDPSSPSPSHVSPSASASKSPERSKPSEPKHPSLPPEDFPALRKLYASTLQAAAKSSRALGTSHLHPTLLEDAGFRDVRATYINVPVGTWPDDPKQKQLGKMFLVVVMEGLETTCMRVLTKYGDDEKRWSEEEFRSICEEAKREVLEWGMKDHLEEGEREWCVTFKSIIGRKSRMG